MVYSDVAVAVRKSDYTEIGRYIENIPESIKEIYHTPDESYLIFRWKSINWSGSEVETLMSELEEYRHAFIKITEDGDITHEVLEEDKNGVNEEFWEVLSWGASIKVFGRSREGAMS